MAAPLPSNAELAAFKNLRSSDDVANFLGISRSRLFFNLYSWRRPRYRFFTIAKASGGHRQIAAPPKLIEHFQQKLLSCLTVIFRPKGSVHGFALERSIVSNAQQHVSTTLILNIDLLDFFPSIHFGRVRGVFANRPFNFTNEVSTVLAQICCINKSLPQGAPTSPLLSNLICRGLDRDLERFARNNACRYTRYADDITISTTRSHFESAVVEAMPTLQSRSPILGAELQQIIVKHDLKINPSKTRVRTFRDRQEVTGLIVNKKVNVPRRFVRNIRAILHDCEQHGLPAADARYRGGLDTKSRRGGSPPLLEHLKGKLDYLRMVRGKYDELYVKLIRRAHSIKPLVKYGIPVAADLVHKHEILAEAIWIVVGKDATGTEVTQGTAFSLSGVGIVSARHIFNNPCSNGYQVHTWELFKSSAPAKRFAVSAVLDHTALDLTIIESAAPHSISLERATTPPTARDPLVLVGYPQWNSLGDHLAAAPCYAIQLKPLAVLGLF